MKTLRHTPLRWIAALAGAATLSALAATAASASPHPAPHSQRLTAVTRMVGRDDSGGNGNWAKDYFERTLTITQEPGTVPLADCSPTATTCYAFTASLSDWGFFRTIPGAYTPNQGGTDAGAVIKGTVYGNMHGSGDFATFYATALPSAHLVPHVNVGNSNPSYLWPELAFAPGTTITGLNEDPWGYYYSARVLVRHGWWHRRYEIQRWADTSVPANDDGQGATAGNISG